jgi:hypothetical protein
MSVINEVLAERAVEALEAMKNLSGPLRLMSARCRLAWWITMRNRARLAATRAMVRDLQWLEDGIQHARYAHQLRERLGRQQVGGHRRQNGGCV